MKMAVSLGVTKVLMGHSKRKLLAWTASQEGGKCRVCFRLGNWQLDILAGITDIATNPLTYVFTYFSYGYIDPRGEVREFTYSSGIACDPLTKQPLDEGSRHKPRRKTGYYDYNSNRFVTADGRRGKLIVNKNNRRRG